MEDFLGNSWERETRVKSLLKSLNVTEGQRNTIQKESIGQKSKSAYGEERKRRLDSSLFGKIFERIPNTLDCKDYVVKNCIRDVHTKVPKAEVQLFEEKEGKTVDDSGLWIDLKHGFLCASPDGLIANENALIVVKHQGSTKDCLTTGADGQRHLIRTHDFYYQVQGQLNITGKEKCYFVLYVEKYDLFVEEIEVDSEFWTEELFPKLENFYKKCVAPEILGMSFGYCP